MPRPFAPRRVCCHLGKGGFRPIGRPSNHEPVAIGLDGLEAIRLADLEGLYQDAAAERMGVSRPTYARVLSRARHSVATALLERRVLLVEPGPVVEEPAPRLECPVHGGPRRHGRSCHCPARHSGPCGRDCACRAREAADPSEPG